MSPALIEAIIVLVSKYGPDVVTEISALFKQQNVTIADIEALFAKVKPLDSYGIKIAPAA